MFFVPCGTFGIFCDVGELAGLFDPTAILGGSLLRNRADCAEKAEGIE